MPHLREIIVHILTGIPDIMFCTYVYNYVNICFTLQRIICEISFCTRYVFLFKKDIIIIIIIIIIIYKPATIAS